MCMKNYLRSHVSKIFICVLLTVLFTKSVTAQLIKWGTENLNAEVGLNFGPTFFLGDLGVDPNTVSSYAKTINDPLKKFMKGAYGSIYPKEWLGIRVAVQYTYLEGSDASISTTGRSEMYRKERNLDFKTNMWEAYTAAEFYPLMFLKRNDIEYAPRLRPYVFAGIGVFHFNPQGSLTDQNGNKTWHELHQLHTEGQGFPEYPNRKTYSLTQINIPLGAGIKYKLTEKYNLGFEVLYRKTFTDYIDDISTTYIDKSLFNKYLPATDAYMALRLYDKAPVRTGRTTPIKTRGNPNKNDTYFSFALKFGIKLAHNFENDNDRDASRGFRCPQRF